MLERALRRLEEEIGASESRVIECDQRVGASLQALRQGAHRAVGAKFLGGAALVMAGWLLHRPRRRADFARSPRMGSRLMRGARTVSRLQRWLPLVMPFLAPLLTPLLSRRSAQWLGSLGFPVPAQDVASLRTVPSLNLEDFSGLWFEIARLPRPGETALHDVSVHYGVAEDGSTLVHRRGLDEDGKLNEDLSRLRVPDRRRPGEMEVSHAPSWLSWLPLAWSDHWVIYVDAHCACALVGSPERDRLWLLSRQPALPQDVLLALFTLADRLGFDSSRMRLTPHA